VDGGISHEVLEHDCDEARTRSGGLFSQVSLEERGGFLPANAGKGLGHDGRVGSTESANVQIFYQLMMIVGLADTHEGRLAGRNATVDNLCAVGILYTLLWLQPSKTFVPCGARSRIA